jgi:MarR family transcriptional regulator, lower aerobic nicotinate degradation pathway regulator
MESATTPPQAQAPRVSSPRDGLPFGLILTTLGGTTMGRLRRTLKPLDLRAHHYIVLKQLETLGTASQASLAEALGLDYSNMATLTGQLAERGLIERYRHESDKRRYVVELSTSGSKLVAEADQAIAEGEEQMVSALSPEEREQLLVLLGKVADVASLCPREAADDDNCNLQDSDGESC